MNPLPETRSPNPIPPVLLGPGGDYARPLPIRACFEFGLYLSFVTLLFILGFLGCWWAIFWILVGLAFTALARHGDALLL